VFTRARYYWKVKCTPNECPDYANGLLLVFSGSLQLPLCKHDSNYTNLLDFLVHGMTVPSRNERRFDSFFFKIPHSVERYLTPWNRVILEKLTVTQLVKRFPKVHFRVVPILKHVNLPSCFPSNSNILPSASRSFKWSLPFRFSNQYIISISISHACYINRLSHLP